MIRVRLSNLNSWSDCERRVASNIFDGEIIGLKDEFNFVPNNVGALVGTACHHGVEQLLRAKKDFKECYEAKEMAIEEFNKEVAESELLMDSETTNKNDAIMQIISIVDKYETNILPSVEPKLIEDRFNFEIKGVEYTGQIDMLTQSGVLSDLKTSKKLSNYTPQIGAYNFLLKKNGFDVAEKSEIVHIPRLKTNRPQDYNRVILDAVACENLAKQYIVEITNKVNKFLKDNNPMIFKANPCSNICSNKYCKCYNTEFCPETKIKNSVIYTK